MNKKHPIDFYLNTLGPMGPIISEKKYCHHGHPMRPATDENRKQNKQQNLLTKTNVNYDQRLKSILTET